MKAVGPFQESGCSSCRSTYQNCCLRGGNATSGADHGANNKGRTPPGGLTGGSMLDIEVSIQGHACSPLFPRPGPVGPGASLVDARPSCGAGYHFRWPFSGFVQICTSGMRPDLSPTQVEKKPDPLDRVKMKVRKQVSGLAGPCAEHIYKCREGPSRAGAS